MSEEEKQRQPDSGEENTLQADAALKKHLESVYYSVVSRVTADGHLMMGQDIEMFPDKECAAFASPGTRAYEAKDRRQTGGQFVLICGRSTVPRVTTIGSYKSLKSLNVMKLIDAGIVNWTPEKRQRFAFVFEKPAGKKILDSAGAEPYRISEDKLAQTVIGPALRALADFRDIGLVHGAINAENIYLTGEGGIETIILGECLSSAASWRQNPIYEMATRAGAQASGRGPGTVADDLYALGVCVAMIARGENLMRGKSQQQIIYEKIEQGSYATIIGRERIPGGIAEFLRGILNDDADQRWSLDDALHWLEGQRQTAKQSRVVLKAARPLVFHEQKYWDLRSLAQAFSENIPEAAVELEKSQFEVWLKRNFEDKVLDMRFDYVWAKERGAARERLVSSICTAMDPLGPIRYKGLSIFPAGFGTALAQATAKGEDIQIYGEIMSQQFFNVWVSQSFDDIPEAAGWLSLLERCRSSLTQKMPGYGIERVLYMTNMEAACLSPFLQNYFVLAPGSLLAALEDISRLPDRPDTVLDRHMIAFISVRESKMIDPYLGYMNSPNRGHQILGVIRTLAAIQRRFAVGPLPGVCSWLISLTEPVVGLLSDRDLRQEVAKRISALQGSGDLGALQNLVDDNVMVREDAQRFAAARQEYAMLAAEKNEIESYLKKRQFFGKSTGRQIAMLLSSVLATISIGAYIVLHFLRLV